MNILPLNMVGMPHVQIHLQSDRSILIAPQVARAVEDSGDKPQVQDLALCEAANRHHDAAYYDIRVVLVFHSGPIVGLNPATERRPGQRRGVCVCSVHFKARHLQ